MPPAKASSSNWSKLKQKIDGDGEAQKATGKKKRKRTDIEDCIKSKSASSTKDTGEGDIINRTDEFPVEDRDKERCCLVNFEGEKIYDEFVRPKSYVTDFRTKYSGVRKSDLRKGSAVTLEECMLDVSRLLEGKILVGHALHNDLDVLMLNHHRTMIRDTATYPPYMRPHGRDGGKMRPRALRDLTKQYLGITIQEGEHDPGIDAKMAMLLYRRQRKTWEDSLRKMAKEKRNKYINSVSASSQQSNSSVISSGNTELTKAHSKKAHSTKKKKSSMFDNCS